MHHCGGHMCAWAVVVEGRLFSSVVTNLSLGPCKRPTTRRRLICACDGHSKPPAVTVLDQGNVKGSYLVPWLGLGLAVELLWQWALIPAGLVVFPYAPTYLLAVAIATLVFSEDLSAKALYGALIKS